MANDDSFKIVVVIANGDMTRTQANFVNMFRENYPELPPI